MKVYPLKLPLVRADAINAPLNRLIQLRQMRVLDVEPYNTYEPPFCFWVQQGMADVKALSRVTLEVFGVEVRRLHSMRPDDYRAEGIHYRSPVFYGHRCPRLKIPVNFLCTGLPLVTARLGFKLMWEGMYGDDAWKKNPMVRVFFYRTWPMNADDFVAYLDHCARRNIEVVRA